MAVKRKVQANDWSTFEQEAQANSGRPVGCGVHRLIADIRHCIDMGEDWLEGADTMITQAIANKNITANALRSALDARLGNDGFKIPSTETVQRHRKGSCSCPKARA
jgi:hypothetical protein